MFNEYNQKQFNCGEGFYFKQSQEVALRAKKRVGVTPLSYSSGGGGGDDGVLERELISRQLQQNLMFSF